MRLSRGRSRVPRAPLGLFLLAVLLAVVLAPSALAEPPPNDNRADAAVVPAFPADFHGTLAEATMERLDPQESQCGSIASTVWYRIEVAPDGIISAAVKGAPGIAPVLRDPASRSRTAPSPLPAGPPLPRSRLSVAPGT